MGFFSSLFSKEERAVRSFDKNLRAALNKRIQPEERWAGLHALRDLGSPEAIYGLLKRFTFLAEGKGGLVTDEEEKNWVFQVILEFGEKALPELRRFVNSKEGPAVNPVHSISQGLQLIKLIIREDPETMYEVLSELIRANEPGYERDPLRKEEILAFCKDWKEPRLAELLVPYLEDTNETVRYMAMECLFFMDVEEVSREPLLKMFLPEREESLRIYNRLVQGFAEKGWSLKGYRSYVEPHMKAGEYQIFRGDLIQKKKGA